MNKMIAATAYGPRRKTRSTPSGTRRGLRPRRLPAAPSHSETAPIGQAYPQKTRRSSRVSTSTAASMYRFDTPSEQSMFPSV